MLGHKRLTTFLAAVVVADTIQTMLNAAKLSLPANTAVGTRVKVSDGFVVSGIDADTDGFYYQNGSINGKPAYYLAGKDSEHKCIADVDGNWIFVFIGNVYAIEDVANPWLVTTWTGGTPTLTHPAFQQLASPSSAQGGVFVSGGTQDGIYYKGLATVNGKAAFWFLGSAEGDGFNVTWSTDINADWSFGPSASGFTIVGSDVGLHYYSLSNVATPDLASNWKNASDDSPASITVGSVTQGELDAGVVLSAPDPDAGSYPKNGTISEGRNIYGGGGNNTLLYSGGDGGWLTVNSIATSIGGAFPWQKSYDSGATVTRNNVAAEPNWSNV